MTSGNHDDDGLYPGMRRLETAEILDTVASYIESGEWWVFIAGFDMSSLIAKIENRYYPPGTEKNADFHMILLPFPAICFAKKSLMDWRQLRQLLKKEGVAFDLQKGKDILALVRPTDRIGVKGCEIMMARIGAHLQARALAAKQGLI